MSGYVDELSLFEVRICDQTWTYSHDNALKPSLLFKFILCVLLITQLLRLLGRLIARKPV